MEVDVGGGVEFGHHYVYVVASHACRKGCEAMAVVAASEGMNLSVVRFVFNAFEDILEHLHPSGVAHQYHVVGKCVGGKMYVVQASIRSQHQFA